jgi:hypothetical protein
LKVYGVAYKQTMGESMKGNSGGRMQGIISKKGMLNNYKY